MPLHNLVSACDAGQQASVDTEVLLVPWFFGCGTAGSLLQHLSHTGKLFQPKLSSCLFHRTVLNIVGSTTLMAIRAFPMLQLPGSFTEVADLEGCVYSGP